MSIWDKQRRRQFGDPCKDCGTILTELNGHFKGQYLQTCCKDCEKIRDAKRLSRSTEYRGNYYRLWKFGLTPAEFEAKKRVQLNGCAICKKPCSVRENLAVDHDHKTGRVRDLLCHRCNVVIGLVEEDDLLLAQIIDYIKKHSEVLV